MKTSGNGQEHGAGGSPARRGSAEILQEKLIVTDLRMVNEVLVRVAEDGSAIRAGTAIVTARRRFVAGAGSSGAHATFLATRLTAGLAHVQLIDTFIRNIDVISEVRDSDLLVAFGFRPYRRATIDFARLFHEAGGSVLAITDDSDSPLIEWAKETILISPEGRGTSNRTTAIAAVSNLIASLATASAKGARRRFAERDRISRELGIYVGEWEDDVLI